MRNVVGATGIIVRDVNTAEDARWAVATCEFPPIGRCALMTTQSDLAILMAEASRRTKALGEIL